MNTSQDFAVKAAVNSIQARQNVASKSEEDKKKFRQRLLIDLTIFTRSIVAVVLIIMFR